MYHLETKLSNGSWIVACISDVYLDLYMLADACGFECRILVAATGRVIAD